MRLSVLPMHEESSTLEARTPSGHGGRCSQPRREGKGLALRHVVSLTAALFCACAVPPEDIEAPAPCQRGQAFSVVSHGWHTGVVVGARDLEKRLPELAASLSGASKVEVGWGDAAFYRAPEPTVSLALRAILYPTDTVLHVVSIPGADLRTHFPDSTVVTLMVSESGYDGLLDYIVDTFARTPDGHVIPLERGLYGRSRFYRAEGWFDSSNTCNTWVARAVAASEYPLRTTAVVTAEGLLNVLRRPIETPCHLTDGAGTRLRHHPDGKPTLGTTTERRQGRH